MTFDVGKVFLDTKYTNDKRNIDIFYHIKIRKLNIPHREEKTQSGRPYLQHM